MKKLFIILATVLSIHLFAQSPEKMSYQAVVRNVDDNLITNTQVNMQISILQGAGGTAVYVETQEPTTNANGLISIEIGNGISSDDFSSIDWSNGPYFIKTELDPTGGYSYTITGISQLLSVPYALHAKTAESFTGDIDVNETDPIYSNSEASNITVTDINKWNESHNWGNHANAGYITELGDLSSYATKEELGDSIKQIRSEMDGGITWDKDYNDLINKPTEIYHSNRNALDLVRNENTGDQNISGITTNEQAIKDTAAQLRNDINGIDISGITTNEQEIIKLSDSISRLREDINNQTNGGTITYSLGDTAQGGIIFWLDENKQHGLVYALEDQSDGAGWFDGTTDVNTRATGDGIYAGEMNTMLIIAANVSVDNHDGIAAQICVEYTEPHGFFDDYYGDWYLPSFKELKILYDFVDDNPEYDNFSNTHYWSSTEDDYSNAWHFNLSNGNNGSGEKNVTLNVRAIRSF